MKLIEVTKSEQIEEMAQIADEIWHEHYIDLLSKEQIDYMVEKFQSSHAIKRQQKEEGYQYFLVEEDGEYAGYMGIKPEKEKLFLSKFYLKKAFRGRKLASEGFEFLYDLCKRKGYQSIYLTVNKGNENSIRVYEKKGFRVMCTQVADIGNGYVMDDFIMEKEILVC